MGKINLQRADHVCVAGLRVIYHGLIESTNRIKTKPPEKAERAGHHRVRVDHRLCRRTDQFGFSFATIHAGQRGQ